MSEPRTSDARARQLGAGAAGLAGLRIGTGPFAIGVELAAGGRIVESALGQVDIEPVLETRVLGELWLSPWFTVGGSIGSSVIDHGDRMASMYLGFHTYSFGGRN